MFGIENRNPFNLTKPNNKFNNTIKNQAGWKHISKFQPTQKLTNFNIDKALERFINNYKL